MFDKLFVLVELFFVDIHTLLRGQEQICHDTNCDFFSQFITLLTRHTDLSELSTLVIIKFSYLRQFYISFVITIVILYVRLCLTR